MFNSKVQSARKSQYMNLCLSSYIVCITHNLHRKCHSCSVSWEFLCFSSYRLSTGYTIYQSYNSRNSEGTKITDHLIKFIFPTLFFLNLSNLKDINIYCSPEMMN